MSATTSETVSIAARDTATPLRAVVVPRVDAGTAVALRDTVAPLRAVVVGVTAWVARAVALRPVVVESLRDIVAPCCAVRDVSGCDVAVRAVTLRAAAALVDAVRDIVDLDADVVADCRLVAFSSRTAALATPMNTAKIPIKCRIFFISD